MHPYDDLYFQQIAAFMFPKKSAGLLLARLDNQVIAAIIFYTDGHTMMYTWPYTHLNLPMSKAVKSTIGVAWRQNMTMATHDGNHGLVLLILSSPLAVNGLTDWELGSYLSISVAIASIDYC